MADSVCSDPVDLSLLALKLVSRCVAAELRFVFVLCRAVIGISLDTFELVVLSTSVLKEYTDDNIGLEIGLTLGISVLTIIALIIVSCMAVPVLSLDTVDKQKAKNKFFITFKTVNLIIALIALAGTIYGREKIVFEEWTHVFLLVSMGMDVLMDPIELIIGCCIVCRQ